MLDQRILPVGNVGKMEAFEQRVISANNITGDYFNCNVQNVMNMGRGKEAGRLLRN